MKAEARASARTAAGELRPMLGLRAAMKAEARALRSGEPSLEVVQNYGPQ